MKQKEDQPEQKAFHFFFFRLFDDEGVELRNTVSAETVASMPEMLVIAVGKVRKETNHK